MASSMHIIKQENDDKLDFEGSVDKYGVLDLMIRDNGGSVFEGRREVFSLTVCKAEAERLIHYLQSLYQDSGVLHGKV